MASPSRRAQGVVLVALLSVAGLAAWYGRTAWADSGSFVLVLFGIPSACTALALGMERRSRTMLAPAVLAVVPLAWSLLTGPGIGPLFSGPSLLLLVAAAVSWAHRTGRGSSASVRS